MKHPIALLFSASLLASPSALLATVTISPSPGFSVVWDSNDGDNFNPANPAPVPANLANAPGAMPFTSSDLGTQLGIPFHRAVNINDSLYGNSNSWIGGDGFVGAPFAGVSLGGAFSVTGFAFGRDNGNNVSDACGGQCTDRNLGLYTIQVTLTVDPSTATDTGNSATGWQTIGTLNYVSTEDAVPGGAFTGYFRHEYEIAAGVSGIQATGLRLLVPGTGIGGQGTAIDEIEVFGTVIPEPATGFTAMAGLGGLMLRRRRQ